MPWARLSNPTVEELSINYVDWGIAQMKAVFQSAHQDEVQKRQVRMLLHF